MPSLCGFVCHQCQYICSSIQQTFHTLLGLTIRLSQTRHRFHRSYTPPLVAVSRITSLRAILELATAGLLVHSKAVMIIIWQMWSLVVGLCRSADIFGLTSLPYVSIAHIAT